MLFIYEEDSVFRLLIDMRSVKNVFLILGGYNFVVNIKRGIYLICLIVCKYLMY